MAGRRGPALLSMIKHIKWFHSGIAGRVAVRREYDYISVVQLAGSAPPASILASILDAALGRGWRQEAEELHRSRKNPWAVQVREGRSGCRDLLLRVELDAELKDRPIVASLHMSMYGKLNSGLKAWLGDLPPLLRYTEQVEAEYAAEALIYGGVFNPPGASSGWEGVNVSENKEDGGE